MNVGLGRGLAVLVRICEFAMHPAIPRAANHDSPHIDLGTVLESNLTNGVSHAFLIPELSIVAVTFSRPELIPLLTQHRVESQGSERTRFHVPNISGAVTGGNPNDLNLNFAGCWNSTLEERLFAIQILLDVVSQGPRDVVVLITNDQQGCSGWVHGHDPVKHPTNCEPLNSYQIIKGTLLPVLQELTLYYVMIILFVMTATINNTFHNSPQMPVNHNSIQANSLNHSSQSAP
jgi:hypothetical protein